MKSVGKPDVSEICVVVRFASTNTSVPVVNVMMKRMKNKMIGEWIENNDRIYEVIGETKTDCICREVLYKSEDPILRYAKDVTIIGKVVALNGLEV